MNMRSPDHLGFDDADAKLIDHLHDGFPLGDRPFAEIGAALGGMQEEDVIERLQELLAGGVLTRLGPLYQIERAGGVYLLAALEVPPQRFDEVAARVNAWLEVAHNYRREHRLNMWFVVAAESPEAVERCVRGIERDTGLGVRRFPKEREYRVELRLPAQDACHPGVDRGSSVMCTPAWTPDQVRGDSSSVSLDPTDRELVAATQSGLPLVPQPYEALGAMLGVSASEVRSRLRRMLARGVIRRIGAVANHYRLGYTANGMTVWDVNDARVDEMGERIGRLRGVTHCYRRPRALPDWPYNLFVMLHGRARAQVECQRDAIADLLGDTCRAHDVLYSTHVLKKTGLRLALP